MYPLPHQAFLTTEMEQYFITQTRQSLKQTQVDHLWDIILGKLICDVAAELASQDQQLASAQQHVTELTSQALQHIAQLESRDQQVTDLHSERSRIHKLLEKRYETENRTIIHLSEALSKAPTPLALPNPHPRYAGSVTHHYSSVTHLLNAYFSPQTVLGFGTTHVLDTYERRYLNELSP
ncbi:hypothetical protein BGX38DRAFT_1233400 [Terfezia claveryi]|nr:hypothetical protein BGX38DRAFT_1233400 [Terfezia claveryi]